jgi:predicted anti-sigma-YlaC factor YlaD
VTARHDIHCSELVGAASAYVDGVVSPDLCVRLEEHLVVCAGCSAYVTQFSDTVRLLRRLDAGPLSPERRAELERLLDGTSP